jgi:hypothetical protein
MARMFLAPTATCSLVGSSAADVKGYVWFGILAAADQSACCAFYAGSTTAEPHLWSLAASGVTTAPAMIGPFKIAANVVHADLTGTRASALVATASR